MRWRARREWRQAEMAEGNGSTRRSSTIALAESPRDKVGLKLQDYPHSCITKCPFTSI